MSLFAEHFREVFNGMEKTASAYPDEGHQEGNEEENEILKIASELQGRMAARGYVEGQLKVAAEKPVSKIRGRDRLSRLNKLAATRRRPRVRSRVGLSGVNQQVL